jgi:hypothetical protein
VSIRLFPMRGALTEAITTEIQRVFAYCKGTASSFGDNREITGQCTHRTSPRVIREATAGSGDIGISVSVRFLTFGVAPPYRKFASGLYRLLKNSVLYQGTTLVGRKRLRI